MILDRRRFRRRTGQAMLAPGASGMLVFTDVERSWAIALDHLDEHAARTLLQMCRARYPHDAVGDMYDAVVVEALDAEAEDDPATATLLADGVAHLDAALGLPSDKLSAGSQTEVLAAMQDDPFFQKVRGSVVLHFYDNPLLWRHCGCEGASHDKGGHGWRGFQDAGWLVEPDAEARPAVAFRGGAGDMTTHDLSDASVVVVIGSGADGGTLANELAQKGIEVVLLEPGKEESRESFVNDEWASFLQLAWLDGRTTSGSWRVSRDFAGLPAWICKTMGDSAAR